MTPTYATLTLGYLEEMLYHMTVSTSGVKKNPTEILFIKVLTTLDPDIKFPMEKSSSEIPFLVRISNNQISKDIFY